MYIIGMRNGKMTSNLNFNEDFVTNILFPVLILLVFVFLSLIDSSKIMSFFCVFLIVVVNVFVSLRPLFVIEKKVSDERVEILIKYMKSFLIFDFILSGFFLVFGNFLKDAFFLIMFVECLFIPFIGIISVYVVRSRHRFIKCFSN